MPAILDKLKSKNIKNIEPNSQLGQVWTPDATAQYMWALIDKHLQAQVATILDPAVGPATFIKHLQESKKITQALKIWAFDIDPRMFDYTQDYMTKNNINGQVFCNDYILADIDEKIDLAIMNPPYIRHEKISLENKIEYRKKISKLFEQPIDGKSNLYIYFMLKALSDIKEGGLLCAIVYDGLNNSRYGQKALEIIKSNSEILSIETIKTPFEGVVVDASIILLKKTNFKKTTTNKSKTRLQIVPKNYIDLNTLVDVKRGTGLLNAKVFMASKNEPFYKFASTFVKKQSSINSLVIPETHPQKAYFFENKNELPKGLSEWLLSKAKELSNKGVNGLNGLLKASSLLEEDWCLHKSVYAPIIFNYYIRSNIRHLLNPHNLSIADNFYGITPKNIEAEAAWLLLNSTCYSQEIIKNARTQGNGLYKLQVYEYRNAIVPDWRLLSGCSIKLISSLAKKYLNGKIPFEQVDAIIKNIIDKEINL